MNKGVAQYGMKKHGRCGKAGYAPNLRLRMKLEAERQEEQRRPRLFDTPQEAFAEMRRRK